MPRAGGTLVDGTGVLKEIAHDPGPPPGLAPSSKRQRRRFRTTAIMDAIMSKPSPVVPAGTPTPSAAEQ